MINKGDARELRNFGVMVGTIFVIIGLWPVLWRGETLRVWALVPGLVLILLGLSAPRALQSIHKVWMAVGHVLSWINTRIILGIVFYGMITPMGLVMRVFGWDSMRRAFVQGASTYRMVRQPRPPSHMKRQF